jgi:hypothetical protein
MNLIEEAQRLQGSPGTPCRLEMLRKTDPILHAEIIEALSAGVQMTALSRALAGRSFSISADSLSRHQRGECVRCRL